jgi:hypothetical protein
MMAPRHPRGFVPPVRRLKRRSKVPANRRFLFRFRRFLWSRSRLLGLISTRGRVFDPAVSKRRWSGAIGPADTDFSRRRASISFPGNFQAISHGSAKSHGHFPARRSEPAVHPASVLSASNAVSRTSARKPKHPAICGKCNTSRSSRPRRDPRRGPTIRSLVVKLDNRSGKSDRATYR